MKKYKDGGTPKKARLEGRAAKKMGKAQRTYKEAEATLSEAKSSGMKIDYADAEQLFNRSARQGDRAKKLKAKAAMMQKGGYSVGDKASIRSKAAGIKIGEAASGMPKSSRTANQENILKNDANLAKNRANTAKNAANELKNKQNKDKVLKNKISTSAKKAGLTYKTGGMVNANSKVSKQTVPGSKGVKSGVNPKASASKVATGRSGGTSTAPKTATPKAMYGMTMKPTMKRGGSMKKK
jgi:hypothetical protein